MLNHTPTDKFLLFTVLGATLLIIAGCSGDDGATGAAGTSGTPGTPGAGSVPDQDVIVQVDTTGDGTADTLAVIDPNSLAVKRSATADIGTDSSLNNSHKSYMHSGVQVVGSGGDLWAFDKETFALATRVDDPSFQMNRDGVVGAALVNTKAAATTANLPKELKALLGRTQMTKAEMANVDICELKALAAPGSSATRAPADTIFHNMGYGPVGFEVTPDGTLGIAGVRQGDHLLVIDMDSTSPTYLTPVRFIDQRRGLIKDKINATVATFTSQYAGVGGAGTAPGNLHRVRGGVGGNGTGEIDDETYVEPCDTNIITNAAGETWFWSVDVDGDTYTLMRVDTITSGTPTVVQITVPVLDDTATVGAASGLQYVGPWMGSMANRVADGMMIGTSENEGENSEGVWDLSTPATPVEVGRYVPDLATIKGGGSCVGSEGAPGGPTLGVVGVASQFTDMQVLAVNVDFTSTGGLCSPVNYTYNSLAGDDGSGASAAGIDGSGSVTTAYLAKNTPTDPGPNFILNGLAGRAGTAEPNYTATTGTGTGTKVFSDELWLTTFRAGPQGNFDVFQIIDLSTSAPWLISEVVTLPSAFAGKFGQGNRFYQVVGGNLEIIDTTLTPKTIKTVKLFDPTSGAAWSVKSVGFRTP